MTAAETRVLELLRLTRQPMPIAHIAAMLRLARRDVEAAIQALRLAGHPLVSDGSGIRWTDDPTEVEACSKRLRARYIHQAVTARALRRTAKRLGERADLTLFGSAL